jgi:hypothetical protein
VHDPHSHWAEKVRTEVEELVDEVACQKVSRPDDLAEGQQPWEPEELQEPSELTHHELEVILAEQHTKERVSHLAPSEDRVGLETECDAHPLRHSHSEAGEKTVDPWLPEQTAQDSHEQRHPAVDSQALASDREGTS